jgi:hypothetical protein
VCDVNDNDDSSFLSEVVRDFVGREYVPIEKVQHSCICNSTPQIIVGLKQCLDSL